MASLPFWLTAAVVALLVISLPYWLLPVVVALRVRIFAWVNGADSVAVPGRLIDVEHFRQVYSHPAADGRSRGAALSDLFWYWLSPGPHVHQEHLEPGERYDQVAHATRDFLHMPRVVAEELTAACATVVLDDPAVRAGGLVRLRDLMMPIWAEFYHRLVFGQPCPPVARQLIVDNATDVINALKCCGLRHLGQRDRLTAYLRPKLAAGEALRPLPASFSAEEHAWYVQGTFFNTAVVQMSEAMAHVLMALARHDPVRQRLAAEPADGRFLGHVIDETLRRYPLFGVAHRITSADIDVDEGTSLPAGSVLCFNYPQFQHAGFADPDRFDPDRWLGISAKDTNFIPFGIASNRPCPAWHLAPITMAVVTREVLARFDLRTSARHTRSMPNRGPCLLVPRADGPGLAGGPGRVSGSDLASGSGRAGGFGRFRIAASLVYLRLRDRFEDVWRSVAQLGFGSYMVWDAHRQGLCTGYFASLSPRGEGT